MKLKLIALAAVLAAAGSANAAPIANGSDGNGGLFFSIWDAGSSYSRNLNLTMDSFASVVAGAGAVDLSFAADSTFTSFLAAADLASLKWNVVAGDNVGARRLLETYSTLPAATVKNDIVRGATSGTAAFATKLNAQLDSSDSTTFPAGTPGYAGNPAVFGVNAARLLNFSNAGTLANNSAANGLNVMLISGLATGLLASTYTPYVDGADAVKVYLDGSNALHISAVTAVPEPESYAMLLAGLGLMGAIARRRNKKSA
ncbi:MAG: PEP-CTERM sorting domain-containing protein [Rhodoferax sp.]|nr:PEP-CTERM sorting domain-containing protein [Rhodoferax sp.]